MSAFIVNQEHISAMLQATRPRHQGDGFSYYWNGERHYGANKSILGQKLYDQNYRSYNYLYAHKGYSDPAPNFIAFHVRQCTPVELIKLCDCYRYQSCETPDWKETEAHAIYDALRERAITRLDGYDEAAWEFMPDAAPEPPAPSPDPIGPSRSLLPQAPEPPAPKVTPRTKAPPLPKLPSERERERIYLKLSAELEAKTKAKPEPDPSVETHIDRNEATKRIRAALKRKTGKTWSVTGGRGTAYSWITVQAPPARRVLHEAVGDPNAPDFFDIPWNERIREVPASKSERKYGYTSLAECRELATAFGLKDRPYGVHHQGLSINPDSREWHVAQVEA